MRRQNKGRSAEYFKEVRERRAESNRKQALWDFQKSEVSARSEVKCEAVTGVCMRSIFCSVSLP